MTFLSKLRQRVGRLLGRSSPNERFLRRVDFPARRVGEIHELLASSGIESWVVGGWGIDALAGRQTRPHQDLDLLVPVAQGDRARRVLEDHDFELYGPETQFPFHAAMVNARKRLMVDLQLVFPEGDGSYRFPVIHTYEEAPNFDYVYSAEGLSARGTIAGAEVPCLTLEEQERSRTEMRYSFDTPKRMRKGGISADVHDLAVAEELRDS